MKCCHLPFSPITESNFVNGTQPGNDMVLPLEIWRYLDRKVVRIIYLAIALAFNSAGIFSMA